MTKTERNLNSISRFSTLDRRTSNFRSRLLRKPAPDDLTERKPPFGRNFMGSVHAELAGPSALSPSNDRRFPLNHLKRFPCISR